MKTYQRNRRRRAIGFSLAITPFSIVLGSFISPSLAPSPDIATTFGFIGVGIATLNAWLSFGRPFLWKMRKGTMDGYRFISGLPIIGTIVGVFTCLTGFGEITPTLLALTIFMIDTAGLPWFTYATWKDQGFWDTPTKETG
jgi:hypothetical protein